MAARAVIFGCEGLELNDWEKAFFRESDPCGFILFKRNCETPNQTIALVDSLRESIGRVEAPVLIDQEGGRVARLQPPHWRAAPAAKRFGDLCARDPAAAQRAAWINARLLAAELLALGITVDCIPLLDLPVPGAHDIIGDRAFCSDPEAVAELGRATAQGLMAGAVMPIMKHIPGHGRAEVDSHKSLPQVGAALAELEATDFRPFRALASEVPWAMTAHVVYSALDPDEPATTSARVIRDVIRGHMGFDGVLVSDDLSMSALAGDFGSRTAKSLAAGCDLALHCNGDPAEMEAVAAAAGELSPKSRQRLSAAAAKRAAATPIEPLELTQELTALLGA